jgi:hypothetical protein
MKIDNVRSKFSSQTVKSWLKKLPNELAIDAIGLWQVIPAGRRNFGLSGSDLEEFTRRALAALIDQGAVPVIGYNSPEGGGWKRVIEYGESKEQIVNGIVQKWLHELKREPEVDDLWFVKESEVDA